MKLLEQHLSDLAIRYEKLDKVFYTLFQRKKLEIEGYKTDIRMLKSKELKKFEI